MEERTAERIASALERQVEQTDEQIKRYRQNRDADLERIAANREVDIRRGEAEHRELIAENVRMFQVVEELKRMVLARESAQSVDAVDPVDGERHQ